MDESFCRAMLERMMGMPQNPFHPLVWLHGDPVIGEGVYIAGFSIVNAKGSSVTIGDGCDIASFVAINVADSHEKCLGLSDEISRQPIVIEHHVFIGSHAIVRGGAHIGHHSVIGAGTNVGPGRVPPYSLVVGNPAVVKAGYYKARFER